MTISRAVALLNRGRTYFISRLTDLHQLYHDHVLLYALSSNAPDVESLLVRISSLWPQSVGCLSAALPDISRSPAFSCSLAFIPKASCVTFRSTLEGQRPTEVGRRHASRRAEDSEEIDLGFTGNLDSVNWSTLWETQPPPKSLPSELQTLRSELFDCNYYDSKKNNH